MTPSQHLWSFPLLDHPSLLQVRQGWSSRAPNLALELPISQMQDIHTHTHTVFFQLSTCKDKHHQWGRHVPALVWTLALGSDGSSGRHSSPICPIPPIVLPPPSSTMGIKDRPPGVLGSPTRAEWNGERLKRTPHAPTGALQRPHPTPTLPSPPLPPFKHSRTPWSSHPFIPTGASLWVSSQQLCKVGSTPISQALSVWLGRSDPRPRGSPSRLPPTVPTWKQGLTQQWDQSQAETGGSRAGRGVGDLSSG